MTLKVIGAGFGRTGTLSLKLALDQLGFGPTYHMVEVFKNPAAPRLWIDAADGNPDWAKIFEGYNSTVDWPNATYYEALAKAYPDARVILTRRDPEAWFASTQATIFANMANPPPGDFAEFFDKTILNLFDGRTADHDHVIAVYDRHNAEVRERIAPERLLVYEVAQGWDPLCAFLGVPVPEAPMPKVNSTEEFRAQRRERLEKKGR